VLCSQNLELAMLLDMSMVPSECREATCGNCRCYVLRWRNMRGHSCRKCSGLCVCAGLYFFDVTCSVCCYSWWRWWRWWWWWHYTFLFLTL